MRTSTIGGAYPLLNERFDVKHIGDDLHLGGLLDPPGLRVGSFTGRIILTSNVKIFARSSGATPASSVFLKPGIHVPA